MTLEVLLAQKNCAGQSWGWVEPYFYFKLSNPMTALPLCSDPVGSCLSPALSALFSTATHGNKTRDQPPAPCGPCCNGTSLDAFCWASCSFMWGVKDLVLQCVLYAVLCVDSSDSDFPFFVVVFTEFSNIPVMNLCIIFVCIFFSIFLCGCFIP